MKCMEMDAEKYDRQTKGITAPVYPEIARQFIGRCEEAEGLCLDLGSGNGPLGIAVAENCDMDVILVDSNPDMLAYAEKNIAEKELGGRVRTELADVHELPFGEESATLIVSRGSVFFWEDQPKAFNEIYRVLRRGGYAFIGGGFGNLALKKEIDQKMLEHNPGWFEHLSGKIGPDAPMRFAAVMEAAGIEEYHIDYSPVGLWVIIHKDGAF